MKRQLYRLELNGQQYGIGDWNYMLELLTDYISTMDMYDEETVEFKVIKRTNKEKVGLI